MTQASVSAHPPEPLTEWNVLLLPRHNASWFLVRGILAIAFGIVAVLLPGSAIFAAALIFAAFTFADGLFSFVSGVRGARHHTQRWRALIFNGIVGIAIGVLFVIWPLLSTLAYAFALVLLIALFYLATGIGQIVAAIRLRKEMEGEWMLALLGVSALLLGGVLFFILWTNPAATLLTVAWLIGLYALISGACLIALSIRLRKR